MSVKSFKDFPGLKDENIPELESIGIKTVEEFSAALKDEGKLKEIIKALSGVGPKTAMKWKALVEGDAEEPKKEAKKESKKDAKKAEDKVEVIEEPKAYVPSIKAKISDETASGLAKRAIINGRRPTFRRQEWFRYSKLGEAWRRPRGIHSKMRRHLKRRTHMVDIGYRGPAAVRGLHPSGFEEVMVYNVDGLTNVDPNVQAVRIGGTVGTKKRLDIQAKADELGIRGLNRMV